MKLITLNIWGGKVFEQLIDFFKKHAENTDIFCLQEVFDNGLPHLCPPDVKLDIFSDIKKALPEFKAHLAPSQEGGECLAILVKPDLHTTKVEDFFVFGSRNSITKNNPLELGRNVQYFTFIRSGIEYLVANFHGLWNGNGKTDTPDRFEQSRKIKVFLEQHTDKKCVLVGDFNLLPDTESIKMLENNMVNLIKEYQITSTRSTHYTKEPKFADYIFVSPGTAVNNFKVLSDEVSDHLPLMLEFN